MKQSAFSLKLASSASRGSQSDEATVGVSRGNLHWFIPYCELVEYPITEPGKRFLLLSFRSTSHLFRFCGCGGSIE